MNLTKNIDCIMPAAGLSSRMGSWKLMLPYQDHTIVEASVNNALNFCSRVILVAGFQAEQLAEKMAKYENVNVIVNKNYQQGMLSSIKFALEYVKTDYFFIAHADMPCLHADIYQKLWQARRTGAVFPGSLDLSGHPVLLSLDVKNKVLASHHGSMKAILKQGPQHYLHLDTPEIHLDVDTPEAYSKLSF